MAVLLASSVMYRVLRGTVSVLRDACGISRNNDNEWGLAIGVDVTNIELSSEREEPVVAGPQVVCEGVEEISRVPAQVNARESVSGKSNRDTPDCLPDKPGQS